MTNNIYDILKWIASPLLPACGALYAGLSEVWGLPYGFEIVTTFSLLATFVGAFVGVSNHNYKKAKLVDKL